ncbi:MAG: NADP-dependent 3-hydroxy acid dehydrogenase YdfG [Ascidiaceihabitans sp.]|jgi:NADP-dependent 3-hydroxy acid dehydrogenase YdfG
MGNLNGAVAWVTGAGGGNVEASAKARARSGAHVVLSGRRREEQKRVVDATKSAFGTVDTARLDLVDVDATQALGDNLNDITAPMINSTGREVVPKYFQNDSTLYHKILESVGKRFYVPSLSQI